MKYPSQVVDYSILGVYLLGGICFLVSMFVISKWIQPKESTNSPSVTTPYECGELPLGSADHLFSIRYYVFALVFVLFEVELLFLLPWATIMGQIKESMGSHWAWVAFAEMSLFVGLLLLGWLYAWKRGNLQAIRPLPRPLCMSSKVPGEMYESLNSRYERKSSTDSAPPGH